MIRQLRIAVLLYILAFVALGSYLTAARSTDWDTTLWVDVYPINASGTERVQAYVDGLAPEDFDAIERFLSAEARRYGVRIDWPFRVELAEQLHESIPTLPANPSMLDALLWSLRMRWFATRVQLGRDRPSPDIALFAVFHDEAAAVVLDRSAALQRALIAVANVFASTTAKGSNQMVMAHELLHTLGATDKYLVGSNFPMYPQGYAEPDAHPLHPQARAELMAGRIPIDDQVAEIPSSLDEVRIGPETALEIGWLRVE